MIRVMLFFWALICSIHSAYSWQFMVHFIIGFHRLGGITSTPLPGEPTKYAGFYNLPDIWDNMPTVHILDDAYPALWEGWNITDEFCWSHAARRNGSTWTVPNIPDTIYQYDPLSGNLSEDDSRDPGRIMLSFIPKLNSSDNENKLAEATAEYFLIHNRADGVVHYRYFGGAQNGLSLIESIEAWRIGHARKERWADLVIAVNAEDYNGDPYLIFHETGENAGKIKSFCGIEITDYSNQIIAPLPCSAISTEIIILSQLAARKNRQILDNGSSPARYHTINQTSQIHEMIATCEAENNKKLRETTKMEYDVLCNFAVDNGWCIKNADGTYDFDSLLKEFNRALEVTQ